MTEKANDQIERLKTSLAELRSNRHHFSGDSFAQISMVLLQALRNAQTEALPGDPQADEIRLVTVMFVDVKDSTEMVQRLDTSDWKGIIAQAHERIAALVSQWGGQVGQYLGDGVMCFFGARHSQDADAVNAVSCGLAIQEAIHQYAKVVAEQHTDIDFAMRIGISTGQLVVGLMGSEDQKREFLALGPATNRAARLQGIAEPGEVFIDEATHARVRHDFAMEAQEPARLKGFEKVVRVYKVLGQRARPANQFTNTDIQGFYLPLVGRDESLGLIEFLTEQATQTKRGQIITILGDIGVGKSRLLQAAAQRMDKQFRTYALKVTRETSSQRYNLIVESAASYGYTNTEDNRKSVKLRQRFIARATEIVDEPVTDKAANVVFALAEGRIPKDDTDSVDSIVQWWGKVAEKEPLLILIDNLQWVDDASVQLLEKLAEELQDKSAVVIAAGRLDFLTTHPGFLQKHTQHTRILLDPLQEDAARLLVNSVMQHVQGVPTALVDLIVERSEGNPLFIQEYLTMLFDLNIIENNQQVGWKLNFEHYNDALNELPHGLIALLQARLDELEPEARQVLQMASVMGLVFWADAIEAMTRMTSVERSLDLLKTQGILVREENSIFPDKDQYRFRYKLYHNVAYEMIPRGQRLRYHQLFAEWLLLHTNGQSQGYPLLATQFAKGERYAAALYTYQEAVHDRLQHDDGQGALDLIETGLGLASHLPRSEALPVVSKLWLYRGQALCLSQRYEEASAACQSALMLTRELPTEQFKEVRAAAEITLAEAFIVTGRSGDAGSALKRAQQMISDDATALRAAFWLRSGMLSQVQGRMADAEADFERAKRNAEKANNQRYLRMTRRKLANLLLDRGRVAEALAIFRKQHRSAKEAENDTAIRTAQVDLAQVYLALELPIQALELLEDVMSLDDLPSYAAVQAQLVRGLAYLQSEVPAQQKEGKKLIAALAEQHHEESDLQQRILITQAQSLLHQAAYEEALILLQKSVSSSAQGDPILQARRLRLLGEAHYRLKRPEAERYFREALQGEETYGGLDRWRCHTWLARITDDEHEKAIHQRDAAAQVQALADSLAAIPELRTAYLEAPAIRAVLQPTLQTE